MLRSIVNMGLLWQPTWAQKVAGSIPCRANMSWCLWTAPLFSPCSTRVHFSCDGLNTDGATITIALPLSNKIWVYEIYKLFIYLHVIHSPNSEATFRMLNVHVRCCERLSASFSVLVYLFLCYFTSFQTTFALYSVVSMVSTTLRVFFLYFILVLIVFEILFITLAPHPSGRALGATIYTREQTIRLQHRSVFGQKHEIPEELRRKHWGCRAGKRWQVVRRKYRSFSKN